jgi:hypothetical protein
MSRTINDSQRNKTVNTQVRRGFPLLVNGSQLRGASSSCTTTSEHLARAAISTSMAARVLSESGRGTGSRVADQGPLPSGTERGRHVPRHEVDVRDPEATRVGHPKPDEAPRSSDARRKRVVQRPDLLGGRHVGSLPAGSRRAAPGAWRPGYQPVMHCVGEHPSERAPLAVVAPLDAGH